MGACSIVVTGKGKTMQDAYRSLVNEAKEEHGSDPYNGEINNCELSGDITHRRSDFKDEGKFIDWIIEDKAQKREVYGFCVKKPVSNTNQIKTVVTNFPQKGTRKWITKYIALDKWEGNVVCEAESQTECIKKARAYVEQHPNIRVEVQIQKTLVGGKNKVADIEYKKASNEKLGTYTFVGWAPE